MHDIVLFDPTISLNPNILILSDMVKEKQHILKFKKLELENVWYFCFKIT